MTGDEIAICLSEHDVDLLREIICEAISNARTSKRHDQLVRFQRRLCHNAELLTLSWLDRKLEQFP